MLSNIRAFRQSHFPLAAQKRILLLIRFSVQSKRSKFTLPSRPARTRFAPSPTGSLHLGSLRTALFNYLVARATSGQFLLRLEDTDAKRTVPGAEDSIYADLQWTGLQWDEGPIIGGPHIHYRQSERTELYKQSAEQLVNRRAAYRCFCTAERLDELSKQRRELGLPTDYDRLCASLTQQEADERAKTGEKHVIRLLSPPSYPPFTDLIYGRIGKSHISKNPAIAHKHGEITYEDPVLLKSDGSPTYHLANVVDDHHMAITHVVRGTEWISSTPKHLAIYNAFGWTPPEYAHVGLLVDQNKQKLSKRNKDTTLSSMREEGWSRDALVNFAALLGCSFEGKGDVMDLRELTERFSGKFTKGNAIITMDKLVFLQRSHAQRAIMRYAETGEENADMETIVKPITEFVRSSSEVLRGYDLTPNARSDLPDVIRRILKSDPRNYVSPSQFVDRHIHLLTQPLEDQDPNKIPEVSRVQDTPECSRYIQPLIRHLLASDVFAFPSMTPPTAATFEAAVRCVSVENFPTAYGEQQGLRDEKQKLAHVCKILRAALVEGKQGPGIGVVMEILGPKEVTRRLKAAIKWSTPMGK